LFESFIFASANEVALDRTHFFLACS